MLINARYVVPVDGPVITDGALTIRDGLITNVGPAKKITRAANETTIDYGDAVIVPGFVNAHTHLELTGLAGRMTPSSDFVGWLRSLVETFRQDPPTCQSVQTAVRDGVEQSLACGVTTVGDITSAPAWTRESLAASSMSGVSFGEVIAIGKRRGLLEQRLNQAATTECVTDRLRAGISPHAPYTVEPDGLRACAHRSDQLDMPLCIHLAETAYERSFSNNCTGPLADYLRSLGVWDEQIPKSGCGPVELAHRTGVLSQRTVIAHANYVDDADIELIRAAHATVAYCPRTHHAFDHAPHRFRDMLRAGINVCAGTDSLASNPSLSILDELRFIHELYPDFPTHDLLTMGTIAGARALELTDEVGSLAVGKRANLVVLSHDSGSPTDDWSTIFESMKTTTVVYVEGETITNG